MKQMKTVFKIIAGCVIVISSILAFIGEVIFYLMSNRKGNVDFLWDGKESKHDRKIREKREKDLEWLENQELTEYSIKSSDGLKLKATLLKAKKPSNNYVLAIHGYRATGHKEFDSISRFYRKQGVNVFMIDHRASGKSEGTYITYGAKEVEDCMLWLDFMNETFGDDIKIAIHGCSMGSATTMMLLGKKLPPNVVFAVSDCGYSSLKKQLCYNFKGNRMPSGICYQLYRLFALIHAKFDADSVTPAKSLKNCTIPVIFAHGKKDDFVPFEMVYTNYEACPVADKTLITVDGAKHVQAFQCSDELKEAIKEYIFRFM